MATRIHIRSASRFPVACPLYFLSDHFLGKGTATDLSPGGWRVEGDHQVATGQTLVLRVCLPDQERPVDVEQAVVRWCRDLEFGLQVQKIGPGEQGRLAKFVLFLIRQSYSWRG